MESMYVDSTADRDLEARELMSLVSALAADRPSWEPHVRLDGERRHCHPLVRSPFVTVWLLCWIPGQDTGFHDHDGAAGAVAVLQGSILEERLRVGGPPIEREHGAGSVFDFGSSVIHRVGHAKGEPAVTIHAYSPALRRMGAYDIDASGELLRRALDEDVELGTERVLTTVS